MYKIMIIIKKMKLTLDNHKLSKRQIRLTKPALEVNESQVYENNIFLIKTSEIIQENVYPFSNK